MFLAAEGNELIVRSRCPDIGIVPFCVFIDLDFVSVYKHAKKELSGHQLASRLVMIKNAYVQETTAVTVAIKQ